MYLISAQSKTKHALRFAWAYTHTDLVPKTRPKEKIQIII